MSHVFISYVRDNSDDVARLANELKSRHVTVWLDRSDIEPGARWRDAIKNAIRDGKFFLACFSKELNERDRSYMNEELTLAIDELRARPSDRIWFIPVLLNESMIPSRSISQAEDLSHIQAVKLYENWNDGVQRILRVLKHDDPFSARIFYLCDILERPLQSERLFAIRELQAMGPAAADAVPALALALTDQDAEVRRGAVIALGGIGPAAAAAVPALIVALGDQDLSIRRSAAEVIGGLGAAAGKAIPALIQILADEDADVRRHAADALGRIGPAAAEAVPALIKMLAEHSWHGASTSLAAARALGDIGPNAAKAVPPLIEAHLIGIKKASEDGPDDQEWPGDAGERICIIAIEALGKIGPAAAEAVPALIEALRLNETYVCRLDNDIPTTATIALGRIGGRAAITTLITVLGNSHRKLRLLAADALGNIGADAAEAVPALIEALRDWNRWWLRPPAAVALGKIGPAAVPALTKVVDDTNPEVRQLAAEALDQIGDPNGLSRIALRPT